MLQALSLWFLNVGVQMQGASFWLPKAASSKAQNTDDLFYFILYLGVIFFTLIVVTTTVFIVKYRRKKPDQKTSPIEGNTRLEIFWSVIPAILLIVIFIWGLRVWMDINVPPANALDVRVTAQKWSWSFTYPKDGITSPDLVVPVGKNVRLTMSSKDVIHSFFVPQFRIKRDVLPNRYSVLWFEATEVGEYNVFCTAYCGTAHSGMLSKVKVLSASDYKKWVDGGGDLNGKAGAEGKGVSSIESGKRLFETRSCAACHSIAGAKLVGPALNGIYNTTQPMTVGPGKLADDNYIRTSILEPAKDVVAGYQNVMPSFKGQLSDKQINDLIDYLKSLK